MKHKTTKLTFSEYWKSKDRLISACDEIPSLVVEYSCITYCKIPLYETKNIKDKQYLSFKPNDKIRVKWDYHDMKEPTPKFITIVSENNDYYPCWTNRKMLKWINTNMTELKPDE